MDLNRVIQAAAEAALQGPSSSSNGKKDSGQGKKRGLSMPRAFLIGAGVVTAGRLVAGSRGRDLLENLQDRLIEFEHEHFPSDDEQEEPYGDEDFDQEEPEEPEAEEDEDFEDEEPEEPEAEDDEDLEDEEPDEERPRRRRVRSGSGSGGRRSRR
jgi:hypothetical protein